MQKNSDNTFCARLLNELSILAQGMTFLIQFQQADLLNTKTKARTSAQVKTLKTTRLVASACLNESFFKKEFDQTIRLQTLSRTFFVKTRCQLLPQTKCTTVFTQHLKIVRFFDSVKWINIKICFPSPSLKLTYLTTKKQQFIFDDIRIPQKRHIVIMSERNKGLSKMETLETKTETGSKLVKRIINFRVKSNANAVFFLPAFVCN